MQMVRWQAGGLHSRSSLTVCCITPLSPSARLVLAVLRGRGGRQLSNERGGRPAGA